jgi:hypothetical protein
MQLHVIHSAHEVLYKHRNSPDVMHDHVHLFSHPGEAADPGEQGARVLDQQEEEVRRTSSSF